MSNVTLKDLNKGIRDIIKKRAKGVVWNKEAILKQIATERQGAIAFTNSLDSFGPKHTNQIVDLIKEKAKDKSNYPACAAYTDMVNKFEAKAKKTETSNPFHTCPKVARNIAGSLDKAEAFVVKNFEEKTNIHTCRFSHLMVFGVMQTAAIYSKTCTYLYQTAMWELVQATPKPPKYRMDYVNNHLQTVTNTINRAVNGAGVLSFQACIEELRKSNSDIGILNEKGDPNTEFGQFSGLSNTTKGFLGISLSNPFFVVGKLYQEWRNHRITKLEEEREWMQANTALLRMELDGLDKDDPEYVRQARIVENYDEAITKLDRKINDYYEED